VTPEDLKYFSGFLKEFQSETDRGAALVGAALIDTRLERLLCSHLAVADIAKDLVVGNNAPLGTFSARIKMSYALGLITELEFAEVEIIRKIRNEFAHALHGLTFENQKLSALCRNLKANTPDGARFDGNPRQLFINSVILLSMTLWYRPEYAAPFKATSRDWSWKLAP
jgi:mannitol operon repressor